MVDRGSDACAWANAQALLLLETLFAKEARCRSGCWGKPLDCSKEVYQGLQCGLSGDQALPAVTRQLCVQWETAGLVTTGIAKGKTCLT
jgi:hypothetical protein